MYPLVSILGLLLFLIYINDVVNSNIVLSFVPFVGDTTLYIQNYFIAYAIEFPNTEGKSSIVV